MTARVAAEPTPTGHLEPSETSPHELCTTVAEQVAHALAELGVRWAFGVSGGAMARLWDAMSASDIEVTHFRHETGAGFAATEASLASGRPVVVFTTTGPGCTNAITGMLAARSEGARVLLISASTSPSQRGRHAIQETHTGVLPEGLYTSGSLFHLASLIESPDELAPFLVRLRAGWSHPGGFVAHLSLPTTLQGAPAGIEIAPMTILRSEPSPAQLDEITRLLEQERFAIWVGYGARDAAPLLTELAHRTGAAVLCTPRAKGIFDESDPQFVGVTGMGGHTTPREYMAQHRPDRILVLGSRLGEPTSFFHPDLAPPGGFIYVDHDLSGVGVAYPHVSSVVVEAEIAGFLTGLLDRLPATDQLPPKLDYPHPAVPEVTFTSGQLVRPQAVMAALQTILNDDPEIAVIAETGNAFAWAGHFLRFDRPGRYRASTAVGSMGHAAAGVLGLAIATGSPSIAVLGDGAMMMLSGEINTAVKAGLPTVWIVLNDACYNMCRQGMAALGLHADAEFPRADFAQLARGLGANGEVVTEETDLLGALQRALGHRRPCVLDVHIDPAPLAPAAARNAALRENGGATQTAPNLDLSEDAARDPRAKRAAAIEAFPLTL